MIRVEHVSKSFDGLRAVRDISFEVESGEVLGFLGPNGAGKTTAMRILAGYFPPTAGRVLIDGTDLFGPDRWVRSKIGYLPENAPLYQNLTTDEFLSHVAQLKGISWKARKNAVRGLIERCGLGSVERRLIGKLSKGFKQRIGLAQALIGEPSFLILDEPTSGLDPRQITEVRSLIRDLAGNRTVILSSHILPEVSMLCRRIMIMDEGLLVASGTPEELASKLRHSTELLMTVRGVPRELESRFKKIEGMIAVRLENSSGLEHEYRIRHRKDKDIRSALSRCVIDSGLELLSLRAVPISLEEIFMKIVVEEEGGNRL